MILKIFNSKSICITIKTKGKIGESSRQKTKDNWFLLLNKINFKFFTIS